MKINFLRRMKKKRVTKELSYLRLAKARHILQVGLETLISLSI